MNLDGEVIGVNIMKVLAADGLGFSVPIDSVSKIIEHFKISGYVSNQSLYLFIGLALVVSRDEG